MKFILAVFLSIVNLSVAAQSEIKPNPDQTLEFTTLFTSSKGTRPACYRIPALATAPNGDLIAAVDERVPSCGDLKWNEDINIVARRSMDNGKTWSPIEKLVDYPQGQSASDPSVIVDHVTGEIFMFFNYMDLQHEKDVYYLKLIKSSDNGKTWSAPEDITEEICRPYWKNDFKFITSGAGIQTKNGKLIHTLVNLQKGLYVFASDNHGKSWYLMDTPVMPADESKIAALADGSWMINSRVNGLGCRYVHTSTDAGKSWQSRVDSTLTDPGCNAAFIRYDATGRGANNNLLLFANLNSNKERRNLMIRISNDEGKTWSAGKTIYAGSAAYASMTVLANGDLGLLFEKDDYREIVFTIVPLSWIID